MPAKESQQPLATGSVNQSRDNDRWAPSERPIRSIAKAASWRITGSIDTMVLSWLFIQDIRIAVSIGLTEVVTKIVLYYLHERAWNRVTLGRITFHQPVYVSARESSPGKQ